MLFLAVAFIPFLQRFTEDGEQMPCYFVTVSLQEVGGVETKNWTVPRRLSEFQNFTGDLVVNAWGTGLELLSEEISAHFLFLMTQETGPSFPFAVDTGTVVFST